MNAAGDGFKVVRRKGVRVVVAVPTHHVERMGFVDGGVQDALLLDFEYELAYFVVGLQVLGLADVPLAVGAVLQELAKFVAVALGRNHGAVALRDHQTVVFGVEVDLVNHAARHHQVIAVGKGEVAQEGAQGAGAFVDEDDLVRIGVFVEIGAQGLARGSRGDDEVVVEEQGHAGLQVIVGGGDVPSAEHAALDGFLYGQLRRHVDGLAQGRNAGGTVDVVEQGAHAVKTFGSKQLLVVDAAVGLLRNRVSFGRDVSQRVVDGHGVRF